MAQAFLLGLLLIWIYKDFLENCSFSNSLPQTWYHPPSGVTDVLEVNIIRLIDFCTKHHLAKSTQFPPSTSYRFLNRFTTAQAETNLALRAARTRTAQAKAFTAQTEQEPYRAKPGIRPLPRKSGTRPLRASGKTEHTAQKRMNIPRGGTRPYRAKRNQTPPRKARTRALPRKRNRRLPRKRNQNATAQAEPNLYRRTRRYRQTEPERYRASEQSAYRASRTNLYRASGTERYRANGTRRLTAQAGTKEPNATARTEPKPDSLPRK